MKTDAKGNALNIGDEVMIIDNNQGNDFICVGDKGIVCDDLLTGSLVGVFFGKNIHGHTCGGECEDHYGWYVRTNSILKTDKDEDVTIEIRDIADYYFI